MGSKPTVRFPTWADDGTAGQVIDPGAVKQALGWNDDEQPPAHWWNWWKNAVGQYISAFGVYADIERRNFQRLLMADAFTGAYFTQNSIESDGATRAQMVSGLTAQASGLQMFLVSDPDGGFGWAYPASGALSTGAFRQVIDVAFDVSQFCGLCDDSNSRASGDAFATAVTTRGLGWSGTVTDQRLGAANSLFVAVKRASDADIEVAITVNPLTTPWGLAVTPVIGNDTFIGRPEYGNGDWLIPAAGGVIRSTDNGANWSTIAPPAGPGFIHAVKYSAAQSRWLAVGSTAGGNGFWYSTDGTVWTLGTTSGAMPPTASILWRRMAVDAAGLVTAIGGDTTFPSARGQSALALQTNAASNDIEMITVPFGESVTQGWDIVHHDGTYTVSGGNSDAAVQLPLIWKSLRIAP